MSKKEQKYVAIYIRVSTLDQANEGYSLDMQERTLRKWCEDHKYEVFDLYADRGISGKDIDHRPELRRLLNDAKASKFNIVLFWALSRFTRSVANLYTMMEKFQKWNIDLISYTESFDTSTSMVRAMIGIVGVFAQLERELTSERIKATMEERAIQGKRTCHEVMGYDKKGTDSFTINETEAVYIRFCFDEYLKRKNLLEVAAEARRLGFKGKRGAAPQAYTVERILMCPIYCGYNTLNGKVYKGNHEPIIDVKTYNRVQHILYQQGKIVGSPRQKKLITISEEKKK